MRKPRPRRYYALQPLVSPPPARPYDQTWRNLATNPSDADSWRIIIVSRSRLPAYRIESEKET